MSPRRTVNLNVNGKARRVSVPPMKRLLDVLREECGLTGTKEGCGEGECGACTVLLDGAPVNSCLVPAVHADGARVVTVEGLARGERLDALQQAFAEHGGAQCGMCTPGMLVTASALLAATRGRVPGDAEVRAALSGTLCRCTGYQKIVDAVRDAARRNAAPRRTAASKARSKPASRRAAASKARAKPAPRRTAASKARSKPASRRAVAARKSARKPAARGGRRS